MVNTDVETLNLNSDRKLCDLQPREMSGVESVRPIEPAVESAVSDGEELELVPFEMEQLSFVEVETSESLNREMDEIPNQLEFKIGTAAELVGVKPYVLRFWESEFEGLRPKKSRKGQRVYSRRDVETAMIIKKLLYEDRFSIEGARSRLRELRMKIKEERVQQESVELHAHERSEAVNKACADLRQLLSDLNQFRSLIA